MSQNLERIELFIEVDKLHIIHVGLERFLEKWTKKRLTELENPDQFESHRKIVNFVQWINRFALAGGGVLTLTDYPKIGGSISIFYPLAELFISFLREKIEKKNRSWEDFFKDSENLGNSLDNLSAITESVKILSSEKLNNASEKLNDEIYEFLKEYDANKNKKIEVSELKIDRFAKDLKEKWEKGKKKSLKKIMLATQILQEEIFIYRHHP